MCYNIHLMNTRKKDVMASALTMKPYVAPVFAGVDPGFPVGGVANALEGTNKRFLPNFPKKCMKLRKFWALGGRPLDRCYLGIIFSCFTIYQELTMTTADFLVQRMPPPPAQCFHLRAILRQNLPNNRLSPSSWGWPSPVFKIMKPPLTYNHPSRQV